ncbi:hypothetical protein BJP40_02665 [Streptomyces sp. CC53]|uniref:phiSA1p31-related protein n=1 Tax=Streptomyces sp. CC53 TaxID=1906740 RepID=UPI0008DD3ECB|nr:phiSA1p31-related protein [Streptomyces sp. CC53]OII63800.1 hypothetical protein BJP40_02665 [Streptomyces sp. CC53]
MRWVLDGTELDLTRQWIDVYGARWEWRGLTSGSGEPLMHHLDEAPMPLSEVYATYGPLIPAPRSSTSAEIREALVRPAAERCPRAAAPTPSAVLPVPVAVPALRAPAGPPPPGPSPRVFAALLQRLRGRR